MWHDGAYTNAVAAFVTETCGKPEVRCVSYRELAEWLDTVPADQLAAWQAARFPAFTAPSPAYGSPVPGAPTPRRVDAAPGGSLESEARG